MAIIMAMGMDLVLVIATAIPPIRATRDLGATISMGTLAMGTEWAMATALDLVIATVMAMATGARYISQMAGFYSLFA